jgi:hypothetical protein
MIIYVLDPHQSKGRNLVCFVVVINHCHCFLPLTEKNKIIAVILAINSKLKFDYGMGCIIVTLAIVSRIS